MIRSRNPYGMGKPASKHPASPYKGENRRQMRESWAAFCTEQCPHAGRLCDHGPCKDFVAAFGRRKGV